jgi:putative endonuclease
MSKPKIHRNSLNLGMKGYLYILLCADGSFYTGSTNDLERRLEEHQKGEGANHTRKRLPVELVYTEEYDRIDEAYFRERQIHGWSRDKKIALIEGRNEDLPGLAKSSMLPSTSSGSVASKNNIDLQKPKI